LKEAARHLGLTDRVRFLGHLEDVRPAIFASSVVVHPSWAETFGYALFEAAQCRRPVVALDRPNMNALIPEAVPGVLVEKATPASFAAGVAQALERDWSEAIFEAAERVRRRRYNAGLVRQQWVQLLDAF
jgi:glycosyltransferase involved in cell wall biosynthesis